MRAASPRHSSTNSASGSPQSGEDCRPPSESCLTRTDPFDQILNGEFYIVSHAYNMERINARHAEIERAFATDAPRYDGDDEYDVRTFFAALAALGQSEASP